MTRSRLNRRLRFVYFTGGLILAVALVTRLLPYIPGLEKFEYVDKAPLVYEYVRDMAVVFVTMVAAYLANVFQKRNKFVASLEEEWRAMVKTKTKLMTFCQRDNTTLDDYLDIYERMSATLDNMRIVYCNVGETNKLIGLYPYTPLHDMRRALETLDPRHGSVSKAQRELAGAAVQRSFTALRETFLEELDLEEPTHGLLVSGARRTKRPGSARYGRSAQNRQIRRLARRNRGADDPVGRMLDEANKAEQARDLEESKR